MRPPKFISGGAVAMRKQLMAGGVFVGFYLAGRLAGILNPASGSHEISTFLRENELLGWVVWGGLIAAASVLMVKLGSKG